MAKRANTRLFRSRFATALSISFRLLHFFSFPTRYRVSKQVLGLPVNSQHYTQGAKIQMFEKFLLGHPVILLPTKYLDHNIYISAKAYYYLSYALRPLLLPQHFLTLPQIFLNLISSRRKILRSAAAYYTRILYVKYHAVQCIHSYKKTSWLDGIR